MSDTCPTCGSSVRLVSTDEGTSYYTSTGEAEARVRELEEALTYIADLPPAMGSRSDAMELLDEAKAKARDALAPQGATRVCVADESACFDPDCLRHDDPSFRGEEMDGFNMTERNPDGTVAEP